MSEAAPGAVARGLHHRADTMLHIHCGDSSADGLRASGAAGEVFVWADTLWEGPLAGDSDGPAFRRARAEHLAAGTREALPVSRALAWLEGQARALERFREFDEVVLWFDACLYDQIILARQLDWFSRQDLRGKRVSLVCCGEFPDVTDYHGLGNLAPEQLASLLPGREPVDASRFDAGRRVWAALQGTDPRAVERMAGEGFSGLSYMGEALGRWLEEFPSTRNGLSRLENEALAAVDEGATGLVAIFRAVSAKESRPFFGDTTLWGVLDRLAEGREPALVVDGPSALPLWDPPRDLSGWTVRATDFGRALRRGEADWVERNGVDRWMGGTRLRGHESTWRWDGEAQRLVATGGVGGGAP